VSLQRNRIAHIATPPGGWASVVRVGYWLLRLTQADVVYARLGVSLEPMCLFNGE